jgi:hypothetical protein
LEVVRVAVAGNTQHQNVGKTIIWAREKSTDQLNTAFRHQFDYGMGIKKDTDGQWHLAKAIWRLSAQLQLDIEAEERDSEQTLDYEAMVRSEQESVSTAQLEEFLSAIQQHRNGAGY